MEDGRSSPARQCWPHRPPADWWRSAPAVRHTWLQRLEPAPELFDVGAGNKPDKMRKYAMMFLDSARDSLAEVDAALAQADSKRLAELGHRIKSSSRAVGAMQFRGTCAWRWNRLEQGCRYRNAQATGGAACAPDARASSMSQIA
jgi:HPt (histidine-containing phosphotransfer) domain-containing protein